MPGFSLGNTSYQKQFGRIQSILQYRDNYKKLPQSFIEWLNKRNNPTYGGLLCRQTAELGDTSSPTLIAINYVNPYQDFNGNNFIFWNSTTSGNSQSFTLSNFTQGMSVSILTVGGGGGGGGGGGQSVDANYNGGCGGGGGGGGICFGTITCLSPGNFQINNSSSNSTSTTTSTNFTITIGAGGIGGPNGGGAEDDISPNLPGSSGNPTYLTDGLGNQFFIAPGGQGGGYGCGSKSDGSHPCSGGGGSGGIITDSITGKQNTSGGNGGNGDNPGRAGLSGSGGGPGVTTNPSTFSTTYPDNLIASSSLLIYIGGGGGGGKGDSSGTTYSAGLGNNQINPNFGRGGGFNNYSAFNQTKSGVYINQFYGGGGGGGGAGSYGTRGGGGQAGGYGGQGASGFVLLGLSSTIPITGNPL
jgi:hypothetical protein